jgi:hypothetical protein
MTNTRIQLNCLAAADRVRLPLPPVQQVVFTVYLNQNRQPLSPALYLFILRVLYPVSAQLKHPVSILCFITIPWNHSIFHTASTPRNSTCLPLALPYCCWSHWFLPSIPAHTRRGTPFSRSWPSLASLCHGGETLTAARGKGSPATKTERLLMFLWLLDAFKAPSRHF